jgi:hypothetical protein
MLDRLFNTELSKQRVMMNDPGSLGNQRRFSSGMVDGGFSSLIWISDIYSRTLAKSSIQ